MRKAAIFFQFATMPLLHAYDATILENEGDEAGAYASNEETVSDAMRSMDDLKRCLTDDKLKPPTVATDVLFWKRIDEARAQEAGADEERQVYDALERGERCCRDGVDAEFETRPSYRRHADRKRKRRVVVSDSEGEDDFVVDDEGGEEEAAPERLPSRQPPAEVVQGMRARDRVPARRRTVSMLFDLASRLSREERDDDAALAGNAAATILELMDRALA
jgi:hypothetical protein